MKLAKLCQTLIVALLIPFFITPVVAQQLISGGVATEAVNSVQASRAESPAQAGGSIVSSTSGEPTESIVSDEKPHFYYEATEYGVEGQAASAAYGVRIKAVAEPESNPETVTVNSAVEAITEEAVETENATGNPSEHQTRLAQENFVENETGGANEETSSLNTQTNLSFESTEDTPAEKTVKYESGVKSIVTRILRFFEWGR